MSFFKIMFEYFELITLENLKNPINLRTNNNIVLRFGKFVLSSPNDLYIVRSSCGIRGFLTTNSFNAFYNVINQFDIARLAMAYSFLKILYCKN